MPEDLSAGAHVEKISTGPKPIEGVSISTAGFAGRTERGPITPRLVTSWLDYQRWFGSYIEPEKSLLPYSIEGFFQNGGQRAFVARVINGDAGVAGRQLDAPTAAKAPGSLNKLVATALGPGEWGNNLVLRITPGSRADLAASPPQDLFRLTIAYFAGGIPSPFVDPVNRANRASPFYKAADVIEDYDNLSAVPGSANYVINTVNAGSRLVRLDWGTASNAADVVPEPARPTDTDFGVPASLDLATAEAEPFAGGSENLRMTPEDFAGNDAVPPDERTGLAGLEAIDEISLLVVPDGVNPCIRNNFQITNLVLDQCERSKDRFAVLNVPGGQGTVQNIFPVRDTSYGAIYYPWIRVFDPRTQDTLLVPPSGHVAGIYARTDVERGVHEAPADEVVRGIVTRDLNSGDGPLEYKITKGEHDILSARGVNAIRDFRADRRGIRVWGGRTMSSDGEWKYVPVRRLFIFLEESIDEGTQWVVFEPNTEPTWARVVRSISNFLLRVWRDGALRGVTQEEAFFVRCDRTTMSQDDIDNGRLICYVGVAPVKPAEFVIFRIGQKTIEATTMKGERFMSRSIPSSEPELARLAKLTVIRGIGLQRARVLNESGISDFTTLAKASRKRLKKLFPKVKSATLKRWRKEAGRILLEPTGPLPSTEPAIEEEPKPAPEDLTVIKGIGPARARVLNEAGVSDFKALTRASKPRLQKLFPTVKGADLTRWKKEARLIAEGDIIIA